jgi:hypothetical protein
MVGAEPMTNSSRYHKEHTLRMKVEPKIYVNLLILPSGLSSSTAMKISWAIV